MKSRILLPLILLIILSLAISACGSSAQTTTAPTQPVSTEPVVETEESQEPTPTPEIIEATEEELDEAYSSMLGSMREGFNSISIADFKQRLEKEYQPSSADVQTPTKSFLLDVRETSEVEESGHIQGAVHIPLRELGKNLNKLPAFTTPIVIYCSDGFRSTIAMAALSALGWSEVYILGDGGFTGWVEGDNPVTAGLPMSAFPLNVAKPNPSLVKSIDIVLSNLPDDFGSIDAGQLEVELSENSGLVLIDVRNTEEVTANGSIESENSINIPLEEFVAKRSEWPVEKSTSIVIYCDNGIRSAIALQILKSYGYTDVTSLKGGLEAWVEADLPLAQ